MRQRFVFNVFIVCAVVGASLVAAAGPAAAAETDPFLGWLAPPKDGTAALNAAIGARLQQGLDDANAASPSLGCEDAARVMVRPLWSTALAFTASDMPRWNVDHVPRSAAQQTELLRYGAYRYAPRLPVGWMVPLDPAVRVGDVVFGTDKLGHFFTNGPRYLEVFRARRAAGDDVDDAETAAVRLGVDQENGWLGLSAAGIFSYADLQANWRGLEFLRGLCAPGATTTTKASTTTSTTLTTTTRLVQRDGRWTLSGPFDIAAWVDPCWDEAFNANAYDDAEGPAVARAVTELCPRWRHDDIAARWDRYAAVGCPARHAALLRSFRDEHLLPDPRPTSIRALCGPFSQFSR